MGYDFSIQHFKDNYLKNGLQRPSKYHVDITIGRQMSGGPMRRLPEMYQPENVVLPSRSLAFGVEQFHGPPMKVPLGRVYNSTIILTYPLSSDNKERMFFENWMNFLVPQNGDMAEDAWGAGVGAGLAFQGHSDHANVRIHTLNLDGEISSTYHVYGAFPVGVFPINMGFGMMNDYSRLQVQLEYREYRFTQGDDETGRPNTPWEPENHMTDRDEANKRSSTSNRLDFRKASKEDSWEDSFPA